MKHREVLITFLAIAAIVGGTVLLLGLWKGDDLWDDWGGTVAGIILLAAGLTVAWMKSKFYRS